MANFVIFLVFIVILAITISEAFSIYIATEKGKSLSVGIIFGLIPFVGHLIIALMPNEDVAVAKEAYDRNLITKEQLDKTISISLEK